MGRHLNRTALVRKGQDVAASSGYRRPDDATKRPGELRSRALRRGGPLPKKDPYMAYIRWSISYGIKKYGLWFVLLEVQGVYRSPRL